MQREGNEEGGGGRKIEKLEYRGIGLNIAASCDAFKLPTASLDTSF